MKQYNILFLCTHNSSRSILGEALASTHSSGIFVGYSAGSTPGTLINPIAEELALDMGYPKAKMYSKSWDEFAKPNAPQMDFIITVCDSAASETCPVWIGHPATAHWGFPDPSKVEGSYIDKKVAFVSVMNGLKARLDLFALLQLEKLDKLSVQNELRKLASI
jgi:arsenate reductase (thioredoxin)